MMDHEKDSGFEKSVVVLEQPGGLLSNTPWWLVSVGIHLVLLLGATLIAIEQLHALTGGGDDIVIIHPPAPPPLFDKIEAPPGTIDRKGPIIDNPDTSSNPLPDVFVPEAKLSDHYESPDGEDNKDMKGDSKDFLSYTPGEAGGYRGRQLGKNPGVNDALGVGLGGGGGGKYGGK